MASDYSGACFFARRWSCFVSAIWLMQFSGSYCFSIYSTALKQILQINQEQLNNLSVAKDLGDALGILAGIMSNYVPASGLLIIGAAVGFVGYGVQWLVVSKAINPLPYWTMCVAALLGGNAAPWMNVSVFMVSVKNFPSNTGPVVGLSKAYMGLTAAVFSELSAALFASSPSKLLLLLTFLPCGTCLLSAVFLRPLPPAETKEERKQEEKSLAIFNVVAICLALLLCFSDLCVPQSQLTKRVLLAVFLVILAAPVVVPFYVFSTTTEEKNASKLEQPLLNQAEEASPTWKRIPKSYLGEDHSTLQLLKSWDFLLFYISCFCGIGAGMTFSNNLGQIGLATGVKNITLVTSLFSLGNFFGRIISGNASECFIRTLALPRSVWMGISKLPMIAVFMWLATGSEASLYGASIILGIGHGFHMTVMIPIVSEFYGLKYFGTNYTVAKTSLLAGSLVFSALIAGKLYDMAAWKQSSGKGTLICTGRTCYGPTFMILIVALSLGACGDAILTYFSRDLYKRIQYRQTISP